MVNQSNFALKDYVQETGGEELLFCWKVVASVSQKTSFILNCFISARKCHIRGCLIVSLFKAYYA